MTRTLALLALLLLGTGTRAEGPEDGRSEASGDHFHVICHFENDDAARAALQAAEAVWPLAVEIYGAPNRPLETRLTVNLYRTTADYEMAEARLIGGALKRNLAFAHFATRSAHVALQPEISDAALAVVGLPAQTLQLVAHESSHIVRFEVFPNHRDHPMWFVDGNATWVGSQARLGPLPRIEEDPWCAKAVLRVKALQASGTRPSVRDVLHDVDAGLDFYDRYGIREVLFRYLCARRPAMLRKLLDEIRRTGGGPGYRDRLEKGLDGIIGSRGYATLERDFAKYLDGLEPTWDELYRNLARRGEDWIQIAFPTTNALCWRTRPVGRADYSIEGRLTILPGRNTQMNLLLGRSDEGFVSLAFVAGYGVTVFRYESATNEWRRIGNAKAPMPPLGEPLSFGVHLESGKLRVEFSGKTVVEADLEGATDMRGAWGLGAHAGSCGIWSGVKVNRGRVR